MNAFSINVDLLLDTLVRASWYAAIVIPIVWLVCHVLHRLPRRIHCWIWRVAYIKVVVAAVWIAPIAVPLLPTTVSSSRVPVQDAQPTIADTGVEHRTIVVAESSRNEIVPQSVNWMHILAVCWLVGVVFSTVRFGREWALSLRIRRGGKPSESGPVFDLFQNAATNMSVSKLPRLLESDDCDVPALVGVVHPMVVVPIGLARKVSPGELNLVLRHELGHLIRQDLLWNLLPRLVEIVLFFHPAIWLGRRRWRICQEAACDELVLNSPRVHVRTYADALLQVATLLQPDKKTRFSTICVVDSFRSLRERITAMQSTPLWSRSRILSAWLAVIVFSIASIVPWELTTRSVSVEFVNGDFETGDMTGWTVTPGANAHYAYDNVIQFDIDGTGPRETSNVFSFSVGQVTAEPRVYRYVDVTQGLYLEAGQQYEFGFDWAVKNPFFIDNFDGGTFQLVADNQVLASIDTRNVFSKSYETGTLSARFIPSQSGIHAVGVRINRRFRIAFPNRSEPALLQLVDNFWARVTADSDNYTALTPLTSTLHVTNEKVNSLFKSMRDGTYAGQRFPDLNVRDIPALLNLVEEQTLLKSFPRNPISSQYEPTCREGIIAIWLIEGIRCGGEFPSLNALCLPKGRIQEDWTTVSEKSHDRLIRAYRDWWKVAQLLPRDKFGSLNPLRETELAWY